MRRILRAMEVVNRHHHGQLRGVGDKAVPYALHCVEVARLVEQHYLDIYIPLSRSHVDVLCAALLHDIIEDTEVEADQVEHWFGTEVRDYVLKLTLPPELTCGHTTNRREAKLNHQIDTMASASTSDDVRAIKIADKLSNCRDLVTVPPAWSTKHQINYVIDAGKVVEAAYAAGGRLALARLYQLFRDHSADILDELYGLNVP